MSQFPRDSRCTIFPRSGEVQTVAQQEMNVEARVPPDHPHQNQRHSPKSVVENEVASGKSFPLHSPQKRSSGKDDPGGKRQEITFCKTGSPWATYRRFVVLGTSGTTYLAQGSTVSPDIVVCREERISEIGMSRNLISTSHPNVVQLRDAFVDSNFVYMVYERMEISLPRLRSNAKLEKAHIATICKEVSFRPDITLHILRISRCCRDSCISITP